MCDKIFCMLVNVFSESFEMSAADERGCIRALINSSHFLVKLSTFQRRSGVASVHLLTVIFLWNFFLSLNFQSSIGNVSKIMSLYMQNHFLVKLKILNVYSDFLI